MAATIELKKKREYMSIAAITDQGEEETGGRHVPLLCR